MTLEWTQPLTEVSNGAFPGGKGGRCVRLTTLPLSCAVVTKSGNLKFLEPSGPLEACNGIDLSFYYIQSSGANVMNVTKHFDEEKSIICRKSIKCTTN